MTVKLDRVKTSGTVTKDKEKNWPIADMRVTSYDSRNNCRANFGSICLLFFLMANDIRF